MTKNDLNGNMLITFRNQNEAQVYQNKKALIKAYNVRMAAKIGQRILELEAADNAQQLPRSARFHEHKGKRKGLFSIDLIHPFRLIVLPTCQYGTWVEITAVRIYEIFNPHE